MTMLPKINKVLPVRCDSDKDFFSLWIEYLTPIHSLTKMEQKYLATCLRNRYELSKSITDENVLDETCMNESCRTKIRESCGFSVQQAHNVISKLKKLKILIPKKYIYNDRIQYYKISPSFIPDYNENAPFTLLLVFQNVGEGDKKTSV